MPEDNSGGYGDVEGVFSSKLRDFEAEVGGIDGGLVDAIDFVAHDDGVFSGGVRGELFEGDASLTLFDGADCESLLAEVGDGIEGGWIVGPVDGVFGAEGRFMDFDGGGSSRDSAEGDFADGESIRGAED